MAVTILSTTWVSYCSVRVVYQSDLGGTPTFYLYLNGVAVGETQETAHVFQVGEGAQIDIQIFDDAADEPERFFTGRIWVSWYHVTNAEYYDVYEYVGAAWVLRARIWDTGLGYFNWESRYLEDRTTHQFRVTARGNGNDGTVTDTTVLMVRHPDPPDATWSYSNVTHKVTVVAA